MKAMNNMSSIPRVLFGVLLLAITGGGQQTCNVTDSCPDTTKFECSDEQCLCNLNNGYVSAVESPITCVDFDECAGGTAGCDADFGYCVDWDSPTKFVCDCLPGYICFDEPDCKTCQQDPNHPCWTDNGGCNGASTCTPLKNNGTMCECEVGFTYDGFDCVDTTTAGGDPTPAPHASCDTEGQSGSIDCPENTQCQEINDVPTCVCNPGYIAPSGLGGTCVDIDECLTFGLNNCSPGGTSVCTNQPGTFSCMCATDFYDFPGGIQGTDCRTDPDIEFAILTGGEVCFDAGLLCLSASDMVDGGEAQGAFIAAVADFFGVSTTQISIDNILDAVPTDVSINAQDPMVAAFTADVCITVTQQDLNITFPPNDPTVTRGSLTEEQESELNEAIEDEVARILEEFGSDNSVEDLDGLIEKFITELGTGAATCDRDVLRESSSEVNNLASSIVPRNRGGVPPLVPGINQLSGTTPSPSTPLRFLGVDEEDFFGNFAQVDSNQEDISIICSCIDCQHDEKCGGLWKGRMPSVEASTTATASSPVETSANIHVVLSHCHHDTNWVKTYLQHITLDSFTIVSFCGNTLSWKPNDASVITIDSTSRNEALASWITGQLGSLKHQSGGMVLFVTDDAQDLADKHSDAYHRLSANDVVSMTASTSFGCGLEAGTVKDKLDDNEFSLSAFHRSDILKLLSLSNPMMSSNSPFDNLGGFWNHIGVTVSSSLVRVCYGGVFGVGLDQLRSQDVRRWQAIESVLAEGYDGSNGYMDRSWAVVLSRPMSDDEIGLVWQYDDGDDGGSEDVVLSHEGALAHGLSGLSVANDRASGELRSKENIRSFVSRGVEAYERFGDLMGAASDSAKRASFLASLFVRPASRKDST